MPKLLGPDLYAPKLEDYTPENLALYGIHPDRIGVDIDSTVVPYHGTHIDPETREWFEMWLENETRFSVASNAKLWRHLELIEALDGLVEPADIFASKGLYAGFHGKPHPGMIQKIAEGSREMLYLGDQIPKDVLAVNLANIANRLHEVTDPGHDYMAPVIYSGLVDKRGKGDHPGVAVQRVAIDAPLKLAMGIPLRRGTVPPGVYRVR